MDRLSKQSRDAKKSSKETKKCGDYSGRDQEEQRKVKPEFTDARLGDRDGQT